MRLDQLGYFLDAAQSGSISAGARKANLAQPAFSTHIKALEEGLGVTLFERSAKGVRLTGAGERLYVRALSLFRHVDQIREETRNATEEPSGEVRIVLASSLAPLLAGKVFWEVRRRYPSITLTILNLLRVESANLVRSRSVDFALLPNASKLEGAASKPILAQDLHLVGRRSRDVDFDTIEFRELGRYPLVMGGRENQLRIDIENVAAREGFGINVAYEQDSVTVYRSIVLNGPAYTIVPYSAFASDIAAGSLFAARIVNPAVERTVSFVWHEASDISASAHGVMDVVRHCIARLVASGDLRGRVLSGELHVDDGLAPAARG